MKLTDIKQALAAYQTGDGDDEKHRADVLRAVPHLIAIAEAAGQLTYAVANNNGVTCCGVNADLMREVRAFNDLKTALNELEKA